MTEWYEYSIPRIKTGIPGLDEILNGGFPENSTILITGEAGSSKTIFGFQFIYKGAELYNEPGIFVSFEEEPEYLRRETKSFGWDVEKYEKDKLIIIVDGVSNTYGSPTKEPFALERGITANDFIRYIYRLARAINAKRLVIDSIPSLALTLKRESHIRLTLLKLKALFPEIGVTTLLITEGPDPEAGKLSRYGVEEYVADGVIILGFFERSIELKRYLLIRKMRGIKHSMRKYPFELTHKGIEIYLKGDLL